MLRPVALLPLILLGGCSSKPPASAEPPATGWTVGATAIGTTRFGQSPADFARGLGTTSDSVMGTGGCHTWRPANAPAGLRLMVDSGRVVRVDIDSSGPRTAKAIGVGSTVAEVEAAYPGIASEPHKYRYDQGWRRLIAREADSSAALVFEVDSSVVRTLYAGLLPHALWVEHCS